MRFNLFRKKESVVNATLEAPAEAEATNDAAYEPAFVREMRAAVAERLLLSDPRLPALTDIPHCPGAPLATHFAVEAIHAINRLGAEDDYFSRLSAGEQRAITQLRSQYSRREKIMRTYSSRSSWRATAWPGRKGSLGWAMFR